MELRINELALPEPITWNGEELKKEIEKVSEQYKGLVYTNDQIADAKKDKAALRKTAEALNKERIRIQKEYMGPFNEFKSHVDELIGMIDEAVKSIDKQVKEYENLKAKEKADAIEALIAEKAFPEGYNLAPLRNPRWMNATYSLKKISEELDFAKAKILDDISTIEGFGMSGYAFEAHDVYRRTLDIRAAIAEAQRLRDLAKRKEEAELRRRQEEEARIARLKAHEEEKLRQETADFPPAPAPVEYAVEEPVEAPAREWVTFSAYVTVEEAKALAAWLKERGISIRG